MLRQLSNLWHYGRLRTVSRTDRQNRPHFLLEFPDLEMSNLLELVISRYARPDSEFCFIQIGAFDGRQADPLFQLVRQRKWKGVLVEPQPEAFALLQENYEAQPGLQYFNAAIGPQDGELTLYTRRDGATSIASVQRHLVVKPGFFRNEVVSFTAPCWTLTTLMDRANISGEVDLLQIDAEGFDYEIIRSIDFDRFAPTIIRYEHQILSPRDRDECLRLLSKQGYRFYLEDADTTAVRLGF